MKTRQPEKVLRVGVIHSGRIIEERLILKRADVTVGRGRDATISLPLDELPVRAPLFVVRRGRYHLAAGNGVRVQMRSGGGAMETGSAGGERPRLLPIEDDAQGRAEIGGVMILFHFVQPPPPMPAVKLPELARVRWSGRIDRPFAAILAFIIIAHIGVVMAVQSAPLPIIPDGAAVQDAQGNFIIVEIPTPKEKPAEAAGGASKPEPPKEAQKPPAEVLKPAPALGGTAGLQAMKEKVSKIGIILLVAKPTPGSALTAVMAGDAVRFEDAMHDVSTGVASATLENGLQAEKFRIGNAPEAAPTGVDLGGWGPKDGPSPIAGVRPHEVVQLPFRIDLIEPPQVDGCLEAKKIADVVKMKLRGLQDCYEKELKRSPSLTGRITMAFTITGEGAVNEARIEADTMGNPAVGECLARRLRQMKFPKSECASVPVSYPFIFVKTN